MVDPITTGAAAGGVIGLCMALIKIIEKLIDKKNGAGEAFIEKERYENLRQDNVEIKTALTLMVRNTDRLIDRIDILVDKR